MPAGPIDFYSGPVLPELQVRQLTEAGEQAVLATVEASGQLAADADWQGAWVMVSDAGSTTFTLHTDSETVRVSAYALGVVSTMEVPSNFPAAESGGPNPCDGHFGTIAERAAGARCDQILAARRQAFHYALFAHDHAEGSTSSGRAEIWGNDLIVTLGGKTDEWIAAGGALGQLRGRSCTSSATTSDWSTAASWGTQPRATGTRTTSAL